MSNIFYSNVDANLQRELNSRGRSGKFDRSNQSLNFMLGKIATARLTAFTGNSSRTPVAEKYGVLGGETVRDGRFLPNGPNGFLTPQTYTTSSIVFDSAGAAKLETSPFIDDSRRVGPFVSNVDVNIGDHSMGLLNKASIQISIPNPSRDLEDVEETWLRPGRFVRIELQHPLSAIITADSSEAASRENYTGGKLLNTTLPNPEALKNRYPEWSVDEILEQIRYMNKFQFEGLITSFDLSYTENGQVDVTIDLTGTSNVFTDISMFTTPTSKEKDPNKPKVVQNPGLNPGPFPTPNELEQAGAPAFSARSVQFYQQLHNEVEQQIRAVSSEKSTGFIRIDNTNQTDQFILIGQPYNPQLNDSGIQQTITDLSGSQELTQSKQNIISKATAAGISVNANDENSILIAGTELVNSGTLTATELENYKTALANVQQWIKLLEAGLNAEETSTTFYRYVTLGYLVNFVNRYIVSKLLASNTSNTIFAKIICDDILCHSNYLRYVTSCTPNDILLMPKVSSTIENDTNCYGNLRYYSTAKEFNGEWPGVYGSTGVDTVLYPSRILINMNLIEEIIFKLSSPESGLFKNFTLNQFFAAISSRIEYATGKSVQLKLVSYPDDVTKLLFTDVKYINKSTSDTKTPVIPYSIPMMANHPNGTIVRRFNFDARLPENLKNLSYILNQGDEVTEQEIAPYMNYMFNSKNKDAITKISNEYKQKNKTAIDQLLTSRTRLSFLPSNSQLIGAVYKDLTTYLKYPTDDLRKSQQITAPIFPFDVTFEIDGINGLRYGDVLTFDALPLRYRVNTVFSIIGIRHNVGTNGEWITEVKCIMRPNID